MKFLFKIQKYQTEAVDATCDVFKGQPFQSEQTYVFDKGVPVKTDNPQGTFTYDEDDTGYKNAPVALTEEELLKNIRGVQYTNNIIQSDILQNPNHLGAACLDIEMETGTGKTYVYTKTMFELNKRYGWTKFIVVVPSIAIREGVLKSLQLTEEHFMEHYHKKARFFVYDSNKLHQINSFSTDSGINVMVINNQAFASMKEGQNAKNLIFNSIRDEFGSRRPRDVIAANRPILILDEPQKMLGAATTTALKRLNPLFTLCYSATHKEKHNSIYVVDALDAYNQHLVKAIEVKGVSVLNLKGTSGYIYVDDIIVSNSAPKARLIIEVQQNSGIKRVACLLDKGDNLHTVSKGLSAYENIFITEINAVNSTVSFSNGVVLKIGEACGNQEESDFRRIQIRQTIKSHFEKERVLYGKGIKTLSLFFIDEVSKYRQYGADNEELLGEYGKIFEEEYREILQNEVKELYLPENYKRYLDEMCSDSSKVHNGYFSIDKKTHHIINSTTARGEEGSDDISAYDLILKNKERLLSFDEPTRFIFSHSALREGWDNPNIFQICTLKNSDSTTTKRQEVGRGLRICVDQTGARQDYENLQSQFNNINKLTVVASESYKQFTEDLQKDMRSNVVSRPAIIDADYFEGKTVLMFDVPKDISDTEARAIYKYLVKNDYIDEGDQASQSYKDDVANGTLAPLPEELKPMEEGIQKLIQSTYDRNVVPQIIDGNKAKVRINELNDNFSKKEFQELWKRINHKYAYTVKFDSDELVQKAVDAINKELTVTQIKFLVEGGMLSTKTTAEQLEAKKAFTDESQHYEQVTEKFVSGKPLDLVGRVAQSAVITRRTAAEILSKIDFIQFEKYKYNPEEFIRKVSQIILAEKSRMTVEHIQYNTVDGSYDSDIFMQDITAKSLDKAIESKKSIHNYVFTDGTADENNEMKFAKDLEKAEEVVVYAKLPSGKNGFKIPTPVGDYSPDWAIAFKEGTVKHMYFVAETKGTMESMDLKPIEKIKIDCASKLFAAMSNEGVEYHWVHTYKDLMDAIS